MHMINRVWVRLARIALMPDYVMGQEQRAFTSASPTPVSLRTGQSLRH